MKDKKLCLSRLSHEISGFTLLEVLIAISILAIALTTLYGSQSRSLSYVTEARFNIVASSLVAAKLAEIQSGVREMVSDSGDFGDDYPGYLWQLEVEDSSLGEVELLADLAEPLQKVDLKVEWSGSPYTLSLRYYGYNPNR